DDLRDLVAIEIGDDRRDERAGVRVVLPPRAADLRRDELRGAEPRRLTARIERAARPVSPHHADPAHAGPRVRAAAAGAVAIAVVLTVVVRIAVAVVGDAHR